MTAPPKWHEGPIIALDTETTGVEPLEARIVTAAVQFTSPGKRPTSIQWLIHPETDIPDEAAEVHGWTLPLLEKKLNGRPALRILNGEERWLSKEAAVYEIAAKAAVAMGQGIPLVVHNAAYDLTLLEAELARNGCPTLAERPKGIAGVVDPMVLEKQFDQYRKQCYKAPGCDPENKVHECGGCRGGKYQCGGCGITDRTLTSLCRHYGIAHTGAHDAAGDALASIRLARRIAGLWPSVGNYQLSTIHTKQIEWRREQQIGLREFFRKVGKHEEADGMCPEWPVHTRCLAAQQAVA